MERGTSQRIAIIALGLITVVLIGISVYIAIQLQTQQAPPDASASGQCCAGGTCADGRTFGPDTNGIPQANCAVRAEEFCGGPPASGGETITCPSSPPPTSDNTTDPGNNNNTDNTNNDGFSCWCTGQTTCENQGWKWQGGENYCNFNVTENKCCNQQAQTGGPSQSGGSCDGGGNPTHCASFNCPNGDTSGDGECTLEDQGATMEVKQGSTSCPTPTCGQVDTYARWSGSTPDWNSFCSYILIGNFPNCGGGGTTPTPNTTTGGSTPTQTVTTYNCNSNFQCVAVSGSGGTYSTLSSCNVNCVDSPDPVCGDSCDPANNNSDCPNNHTCSPDTNTCVLNGCTDTTCLNGCSPVCGGPCNPGDPNSCPDDHTCSEASNTCIADVCLAPGANCSANKCTVLPDTGLFDEEYSPLMWGLFLILMAIVSVKYNLIGKLNYNLATASDYLGAESRTSRKIKRDRESFENKFEE